MTTTRTLPESLRLSTGSHSPDGEMCVMEAVAYVAGEPWSDHPACACPILTAYCIALNDRMPDDQRQRLLPYVVRLVGTRSTPEVELRRAYRAADWAVRRFAAEALRAAGLETEAVKLQELAPIVDASTAEATARAAAAARAAAEAAARAGAWTGEAATAARAGAWTGEAAAAARAGAWAAAWAAAAATAARAARAAIWNLSLLCLDDMLAIV